LRSRPDEPVRALDERTPDESEFHRGCRAPFPGTYVADPRNPRGRRTCGACGAPEPRKVRP
jgi:hypothetical protein